MPFRSRLRPDFARPLGADPDAVLAHLRTRLTGREGELLGQVREGHACVGFPPARRGLLSPHLELDVRDGPDGPVLHGRFAPQPNVWTGFMAVFIGLGTLAALGTVYGLGQLMVDETPWGLLAAPVGLALIGFVYGAAFIGQGLSAEQMYALRAFIDRVIDEAEGVRPPQSPPPTTPPPSGSPGPAPAAPR